MHHRFQGMEGDPERAFAELWRRREPAELGGLDVWFPDVPSRSLILVLNAARDPKGPKAREDLRRLVAVASDADWRRTIALARRVDALQALRAGIEVEPDGHDLVARTSLADVEVSAAWRLRAQGSTLTAVRIEELRSLGTVAKIRTMAAWVVPSPAVIRYRDPRAADSTWLLLRAYAARYRQGVRRPAPVRARAPGGAASSRALPTDPLASAESVREGESAATHRHRGGDRPRSDEPAGGPRWPGRHRPSHAARRGRRTIRRFGRAALRRARIEHLDGPGHRAVGARDRPSRRRDLRARSGHPGGAAASRPGRRPRATPSRRGC